VWDDAPLFLACLHGDRPLAELLLRHGASLNAGSGRALRTPLGEQLRTGTFAHSPTADARPATTPRTFGEILAAMTSLKR